MRKNFAVTLFISCLTILFWGQAVFANPLTLRVGHDIPPFATPAKGVTSWAKLVNQNSQGRINVEVYPTSSLCDQKSSIDMLQAGAADGYLINFPSHRNLFPVLSVESLPGLGFPDTLAGHTAHAETVISMTQKYPSIAKELSGLKIIMIIVSPNSILLSSKKDLRVPSDLKGLKVGGAGSRMELATMIGAAPVFDVIPQAYQKLQTGVLDATTINFQAIGEFKIYEVAKYATDVSWGQGGLSLVMSQSAWDKLSDEDRDIIIKAGKEAQTLAYKAAEDLTMAGRKALLAHGGQIIVPTNDEKALWDGSVKTIWDKWISDNQKDGVKEAKAILSDWHEAAKAAWKK